MKLVAGSEIGGFRLEERIHAGGMARPDEFEDAEDRNLHLRLLAELQRWARPLPLPPDRLTYHVLESPDAAGALLEFAAANGITHVVMGAREASATRRYLGSVSSKVVAEAASTVTVVRVPPPPP